MMTTDSAPLLTILLLAISFVLTYVLIIVDAKFHFDMLQNEEITRFFNLEICCPETDE